MEEIKANGQVTYLKDKKSKWQKKK
jgi:hypothetical protein